MKTLLITICVLMGIAEAQGACNQYDMSDCSYADKMYLRRWIAEQEADRLREARSEAARQERLKREREHRLNTGESILIENSDGTWTEIRSKERNHNRKFD